mgnify:CR=1 FL=1
MHGCCGHMGQVISQIVKEDADAQIVAGIDPFDNGKWNTRYTKAWRTAKKKQML